MAAEPTFGTTAFSFGNVGAASDHYNKMKETASAVRQIKEQATNDADIYASEIAKVMRVLIHAVGGMLQEETMRTAAQIAASGATRNSGAAGSTKGIMEYKVIMNLKAANGDKTWFRQWHLTFTTALGQVKQAYEWLVNSMTKEIDLSKDLGATLENLSLNNPELYKSASADIWRILIDKTEAEAYAKIKSIPQGEGLKACGVLYR